MATMSLMAHHSKGGGFSHAPKAESLIGRKLLFTHRTSASERLLLVVIVALVPMEFNLPMFGEISTLFIAFGVLFGYLVLNRLGVLLRTARCPVFMAGYTLVAVALLMETFHGSFDYNITFRLLFMILGGVAVASLCRDRQALLSCMYGFVLASVVLSLVIFLSSFDTLHSANPTDFDGASNLRARAMGESGIKNDLNNLSIALARGTLVAMVLALFAKSFLQKYGLRLLTVLFGIGTFLPMSRSGVVILIGSIATILYTYGVFKPRILISTLILAIVVVTVVPESVFTRFTLTQEKRMGTARYVDGRTQIYLATIKNLPEYILTGIGRSEFYGKWGQRAGFATIGTDFIPGSHNVFAEVTVLWGLPGLFAYLALVWQAYRCLPKRFGVEPLGLCVLGLAVSALGVSLFSHNFEAKDFSLILGILAGSDLRIWRTLSNQQKNYRGPNNSPNKAIHY